MAGTIVSDGIINIDTFEGVADLCVSINAARGLNYETGVYEPEQDEDDSKIYFQNEHTEPPIFFGLVDATGTYDSTQKTAQSWFFWNYYLAFGTIVKIGIPPTYEEMQECYGCCSVMYRGSQSYSEYQLSSNNYVISTLNAMNRIATPEYFQVVENIGQMYMRAGRTYKWCAVWKWSN